MATQTSVTFRGSIGYLEKDVAEALAAARERGLELDYLNEGVARGEKPPIVMGAGAPDLGLVAGATIDRDAAQRTWTHLLHPETGRPLGQRKPHYAGAGERLVRMAEERGIALPADLEPKAVRKAILSEEISDETIGRQVTALLREFVADEELKAMRRQAWTSAREARSYVDITISVSKDASLLHAAFEAERMYAEAALVRAALRKAAEAELRVFSEHVGSRMGRNGVQHIDAARLVALLYEHDLSRDGDPQLHVHMAILNKVFCDDGEWRALDGDALFDVAPRAAAAGQRVFDEEMARTLGVRHHYDPVRKGQIIDGITDEMMDLFSARRAVIKAEVANWARKFEADNDGRKPNARQRDAAAQHYAYETRKPKPSEMEARPDLLASWERKLSEARGQTLKDVIEAALPERRPEVERPTYHADKIVTAAIEAVSQSRPYWTRHHLALEIDRLLPGDMGLREDEAECLIGELADQALGTEWVTCLSAADPVGDVPDEFRRKSDGGSVYGRRAGSRRYVLTETLSREAQLVTLPLQNGAPKVEAGIAAARVAKTTLKPDQAAAVEGIMSSGRALDVLIGPAGTGKSYTVAELGRIWRAEVGAPVFGLATSDAAANVLREAGIGESRNIARWLKGQERLASGTARPEDKRFALTPGCLVVVDEASMVSAGDLARVAELVRASGGKLVWAGDDHQLAAVEQGGALRFVTEDRQVQRSGAVHALTTVNRFKTLDGRPSPWEGEASLRLRVGEEAVLDTYDRHGRIEGGSAEEMAELAFRDHMADTLGGKDSLLLVPTNDLAIELAMRTQAERIEVGEVSHDVTVVLSNGCRAGVGDRIQARKPDRKIIDPSTGRGISNRDTAEVVGIEGDALKVRRCGQVKTFTIPAAYVARHIELAYASTVHAAQGRTVDTVHGLVDQRCTREYLYVLLTRGRYENRAYVITESERSPGLGDAAQDAREPVDVLRDVMARTNAEPTATEFRAQNLEDVRSLARLHQIWADVLDQVASDEHRAVLVAELGPERAAAVANDAAAPALWRALQTAREEGHDTDALLTEAIRVRKFDGVRSTAKVLHHRVEEIVSKKAPSVVPAERTTFLERTPEPSDNRLSYARRVALEMDRRVNVLAERAAAETPLWASLALGDFPDASDAQEAWKRRAGAVEAYREAYSAPSLLADVGDPIGPAPSRAVDPERYRSWQLADAALGSPDRSRDPNRQTDGQLRASITAWDARYKEAPVHVGDELAKTRRELKNAEYAHRSALAVRKHRPSRHTDAQAEEVELLRQRVDKLDRLQAVRDAWWERTEEVRVRAASAREELAGRHPDVDRSKLFGPCPEEIEAQRKLERERAERRLSDDFGLRMG